MVDVLLYYQLLRHSTGMREMAAAEKDIDILRGSPPAPKMIKRENGTPSATTTKRSYTPDSGNYQPMTGVPRPAMPTKLTAPVHIDIGGTIYTSTLEHLTKYPESRLAKLFNGEMPIILDTMKQHYFIDRDGPSFRYVLQFLRSGRLILPEGYEEIEILLEEAKYYELDALVEAIEDYRQSQSEYGQQECVAVSLSPDLGERICLSGRKPMLEQCFPELKPALNDLRNAGWTRDSDYVIRFPVNGFCDLNSMQIFEKILSDRFKLVTSNGGGVEGQQFSDYLFRRPGKRSYT